jgi:hypothetical protein
VRAVNTIVAVLTGTAVALSTINLLYTIDWFDRHPPLIHLIGFVAGWAVCELLVRIGR